MFGWLKRACSCVWGAAKTVAKKVCDGVKYVAKKTWGGGKKVGNCVAKVWKKFTGQDVADDGLRWKIEHDDGVKSSMLSRAKSPRK